MISAFIACRDHGAYLSEAIESVRAQTVPPSQLILIDDGSKDNSYDIMKAVEGADVRRHETSQGNIASYNEAIMACKQPFIHLMAADDLLATNVFYEQALQYLKDDEVGFVAMGLTWVDVELDPLGHSVLPRFEGVVGHKEVLKSLASEGNWICGGAAVVRKSAQMEAGPYDPRLPYSADALNWVNILKQGWKAAFIPTAGYFYRQHKQAMTYRSSAPIEERQIVAEALAEALNGL